MIAMAVAYRSDGVVVATLDFMVHLNAAGDADGLIDFEAHEAAGGAMTDIFVADGAIGAGTWPEWLGARAHDFAVEVDPGFSRDGPRPPNFRIRALVHRTSGQRRERSAIEATIAARIAATPAGEATDLRDILGGPGRPLLLDDAGLTLPRVVPSPPDLPIIRRGPVA